MGVEERTGIDVEARLEEHGTVFSVGVGLLFGIALLELLPDAWAAGWGALVGAAAVFLFFLWLRWTSGRHELEGVLLLGFLVHAAMEGGFTATAFAAGRTTGVAAVVGLVLHELPEFAAVLAVFAGFGRSIREVGFYQVTAIGLVVVSFVVVYGSLGRIPPALVGVGLGAAGGAFALLGAWDLYEGSAQGDWTRLASLGVGVLVVVGLRVAGLM
jgi:ZIP family zinc transporter/zinc and cadmium transporter